MAVRTHLQGKAPCTHWKTSVTPEKADRVFTACNKGAHVSTNTGNVHTHTRTHARMHTHTGTHVAYLRTSRWNYTATNCQTWRSITEYLHTFGTSTQCPPTGLGQRVTVRKQSRSTSKFCRQTRAKHENVPYLPISYKV